MQRTSTSEMKHFLRWNVTQKHDADPDKPKLPTKLSICATKNSLNTKYNLPWAIEQVVLHYFVVFPTLTKCRDSACSKSLVTITFLFFLTTRLAALFASVRLLPRVESHVPDKSPLPTELLSTHLNFFVNATKTIYYFCESGSPHNKNDPTVISSAFTSSSLSWWTTYNHTYKNLLRTFCHNHTI